MQETRRFKLSHTRVVSSSLVSQCRRGGSGGQKSRQCSKCGETEVHDKTKRSCVVCQAETAKTAKKKGKGKGKGKEKAVEISDSDDEVTMEEYAEDLRDEQLMENLEKRIARVQVKSKLEYCVDTNLGPGWFNGMVLEVKENGFVKFLEDEDGTVHHNFDLNENIWKFLSY